MATEEDTQHRENNNNSKDIDHVGKQTEANPIYDQLFSLGVTLTSNKLGQYAVRKIDRLLWVIENTAKWSVPQNITESETAVPPPPLIRPLNWFLFIPALIVMRLFRAGASFALLMLGYDALAPVTVVHILQKQRRILRAVRYQGLKTIRSRNAENKQSVKKGLLSVLLSFISGLICTRGNLEEPAQIVVKSNNRTDEHGSKKRLLSDEDDCNEDDGTDLNLTCADLLVKYGEMSSCDDSDFVPEVADEDTSSVSDEESELDSGEESEPEGRSGKDDEVNEDNEKKTEPTNTSEPVEIIQNNNKSPVPPEEHNYSATYDCANSHQKSPVPSEEQNHSVTHDSENSHQSKPPAKFFQTQPHKFNHIQPPRQASNSYNLHLHNSHQPSHQIHNSSFNSAGFLAHEKLFDKPHHPLLHHMNGRSNAQHHEPKIHQIPLSPSSLSPTSSTSSSTTNVSSTQAGLTTAADSNIPRKKSQTKYNKYQKNRYYSGGNKQNSKKNSN